MYPQRAQDWREGSHLRELAALKKEDHFLSLTWRITADCYSWSGDLMATSALWNHQVCMCYMQRNAHTHKMEINTRSFF